MGAPKMTLDELRALRPVWAEPQHPIPIKDAVAHFAESMLRGVEPAKLQTDELMKIFGGSVLLSASDAPPDVHDETLAAVRTFSDAVAREYSSRIQRSQASGPAALAWLTANPGPSTRLAVQQQPGPLHLARTPHGTATHWKHQPRGSRSGVARLARRRSARLSGIESHQ